MNINKPGVILITTLLIVMIMSVISIQISKKFFISIQREAYLDFKNQSYQVLLSAEAQAIKSIQKEIISSQAKLTNNDPIFRSLSFFLNDISNIQVDVVDGSNCFNLNNIFSATGNKFQIKSSNVEWLERLLRFKGLNDAEIESFIDQLIDWVDTDSQPLNYGAEDYFYMGPMSAINQFTPKRLLESISEIRNFPIMETLDFRDFSKNLCVVSGSSQQSININTLSSSHAILIAAFFDEKNLEFIESQISDAPEEGYNSIDLFTAKMTQLKNNRLDVFAVNSRNFILTSRVYNETFSNELESLVILDNSNVAMVLNRNFSF